MHANQIRNIKHDMLVKEGIEYAAPFWLLISKYQEMAKLEMEMQLSLLTQERNELHRRCKDNDKPGKRHMLPFVWTRKYGVDGHYVDIQVPLKIGHPAYTRAMDRIKAKIKAVRHG